jgi:hypothetical protein
MASEARRLRSQLGSSAMVEVGLALRFPKQAWPPTQAYTNAEGERFIAENKVREVQGYKGK